MTLMSHFCVVMVRKSLLGIRIWITWHSFSGRQTTCLLICRHRGCWHSRLQGTKGRRTWSCIAFSKLVSPLRPRTERLDSTSCLSQSTGFHQQHEMLVYFGLFEYRAGTPFAHWIAQGWQAQLLSFFLHISISIESLPINLNCSKPSHRLEYGSDTRTMICEYQEASKPEIRLVETKLQTIPVFDS